MNSCRTSIVILSIMLFTGLSIAEDGDSSRGLTQLDFDKSADKKPSPTPQAPINELFKAMNNEAQIKELDTTKRQGADSNLGDLPVEDNSKKPINQLD